MKDIGKKIRELRESQGMTQEELAHKVGYKSRVSINKIELQRDLPIKKIVPIANALGISPNVLMGWEEDEKFDRILDQEVAKEDIELLNLYSRLNNDDKKVIKDMMFALLSKY